MMVAFENFLERDGADFTKLAFAGLLEGSGGGFAKPALIGCGSCSDGDGIAYASW
jgi:hypothetical protein